MKRRNIISFLSMVVAIAFCLSMAIPALAANEIYSINNLIDNTVSLTVRQEMLADIQDLELFGLASNNLIAIDTVNGEHRYSYSFSDEAVSIVSINRDANGNTHLVSTEGNKTDVVTLSGDNKVYINGKEVIHIVSPQTMATSTIMPRYTDYWTSSTCPYGAPLDYTDYQYTTSVNSIYFQEYIEELTVAAIIAAIGLVRPDLAEIVDMLAQVVDNLADDDIRPNNAVSYTEAFYYHATLGYYVSNSWGVHLGVARVVMNCYTGENQTGSRSIFTYYQCASLT